MQTCRLLHYGTGVDEQYDGVIIDGCAYIKAKPFFGSAQSEEENEGGAQVKKIFWNKADFDDFQRKNPTGWKFTEKEGWEVIAEFYAHFLEDMPNVGEHIIIDSEHYFPPFCFGMFETECDNNLVQLEIDGKWGYANTFSGEIVIKPKWDWCGPFYGEYAMARTGCPGKPGARMPKMPRYYDDSYER